MKSKAAKTSVTIDSRLLTATKVYAAKKGMKLREVFESALKREIGIA